MDRVQYSSMALLHFERVPLALLQVTIPVVWIDLADVDEDKLTTDCDGEEIRVRGLPR